MFNLADPEVVALHEHRPVDAIADLERAEFLRVFHREGHGHGVHVADNLLVPDGGKLVGRLQTHHLSMDRIAIQRRGGIVGRAGAPRQQNGQ